MTNDEFLKLAENVNDTLNNSHSTKSSYVNNEKVSKTEVSNDIFLFARIIRRKILIDVAVSNADSVNRRFSFPYYNINRYRGIMKPRDVLNCETVCEMKSFRGYFTKKTFHYYFNSIVQPFGCTFKAAITNELSKLDYFIYQRISHYSNVLPLRKTVDMSPEFLSYIRIRIIKIMDYLGVNYTHFYFSCGTDEPTYSIEKSLLYIKEIFLSMYTTYGDEIYNYCSHIITDLIDVLAYVFDLNRTCCLNRHKSKLMKYNGFCYVLDHITRYGVYIQDLELVSFADRLSHSMLLLESTTNILSNADSQEQKFETFDFYATYEELLQELQKYSVKVASSVTNLEKILNQSIPYMGDVHVEFKQMPFHDSPMSKVVEMDFETFVESHTIKLRSEHSENYKYVY